VITTNGTYPGPFVTQILHNIEPSDGGESKIFKVMTPMESSVLSFLKAE
jgi:hypothetical protein